MSSARPQYIVCGLALSILACRIEAETATPDQTQPATERSCAPLVEELRAKRVAEPWPGESSFGDHRTQLGEACDGGCGAACLELARLSSDADEFKRHNEKACELGELTACMLAEPPTPERANKLCDAGDVLGCGAAVALAFEATPDQPPNWERVAQAAKAGCSENDGRSCSIEAWVACASVDTCDTSATAAASKAASAMPTADVLETLALVHCHAGAPEQADSALAAACTSGQQDACARRCEVLRDDQPLLVREAERDRYLRIFTAMELQANVAPYWYVALSAMDAEQLAGFEDILNRFTPPPTQAGAKAKVPPKVRERFPVLVEAILRAPQLDANKIKYWFSRLPDMTDEQRGNLLENLRNQWWMIAEDPGKSPRAFVERVRLGGGGLQGTW